MSRCFHVVEDDSMTNNLGPASKFGLPTSCMRNAINGWIPKAHSQRLLTGQNVCNPRRCCRVSTETYQNSCYYVAGKTVGVLLVFLQNSCF